MRRDDRRAYDDALRRARLSAYPSGEFVGQESFMAAGEILALAVRAGIGPGVSVLDLCCGVAGPGRFLAAELGCRYLGVDESPDAVALARERAAGLDCRFEVGRVPPAPAGSFDVVLLLETMLAFRDKQRLLAAVGSALRPGGRFAFTAEEGRPLTPVEADAMPGADTVWLVPLPELLRTVEDAGLTMDSVEECSGRHRAVAEALLHAYASDRDRIAARLGGRVVDDLLTAHRLWSSWLRDGRVRKFSVIAKHPGG